MRELTKSILSYTWSSTLFGLQETISLFTPQGWRQTGGAVESFEMITRVTADQMGEAARRTFKVGDDMQRKSMDMVFDVVTLGVFENGPDQSNPSSSSASRSSLNMGEQTVAAFTQGLQAASQTVGVIVQSLVGVVSGPKCGGARAEPTGWGPVPPPPSSKT
ncbi:MAG TPA: hypothetical protein VN643_18310 [Pyrinomonadaceae bacterium]|nr:hypothetical protein [Pyrinomonadaceae bacterium]